MEVKLQNKRPKHLDLLKIRQPLPAVISILHRISGVLLFFPGIPLLLYAMQNMLDSQQSFSALQACLENTLVKVGLMLVLWFFMHHLCAGIRYLALDLHVGITLVHARTGSKIVLGAGIVLTVLIGMALW